MDDRSPQTASSDHLCYIRLPSERKSSVRIPVSFPSRTDAHLTAFALDTPGLPLHVVDAFITLLKNPDFRPSELSFDNAEDILVHVARYQLNRVSLRLTSDCTTASSIEFQSSLEVQLKAHRSKLPGDILDIIASYFFGERRSFTDLARAQEDAATTSQGRFVLSTPCPRVRDLMSMSLVSREWCSPAQRFLRRSVKVIGSKGLRNALLNPRTTEALRELHVVLPASTLSSSEEQPVDLREALFLVRALLNRAPNLEAFYFQTSSGVLQNHANPIASANLAEVFAALSGMPSLRSLWLTHIPGPALYTGNVNSPCYYLQALYAVLPSLQALRSLWVHNWCEGATSKAGTMGPIPESSALTSLSYRLGGNALFFVGPQIYGSGSLAPLFTFAQSISHLHVHTSNLVLQNTQSIGVLLRELIPPPPRLSSLCLTMDSTADLNVATISSPLLLLAKQLTRLSVVLACPRTTLPRLFLPRSLRELHVHVSRDAMRMSALCSQRGILTTEQLWCDLDNALCAILPSVTDSRSSELEKVALTLEPTSSMRNDVERGFLREARWPVEGAPLVPEVMRACVDRKIAFECYRAECPSF